jgi:Flp pilus assembly protein TadD
MKLPRSIERWCCKTPEKRVLESNLSTGNWAAMSNEKARQTAEDHYYAALDLVAEGHHEQAVAQYHASLSADPAFTEAMHGLARALQDLNRLDEAIAVSNRIVELDPDDVLAHTSLSVLYQKKGMIPEAEAEGNKARILGWKQQLKKSGS